MSTLTRSENLTEEQLLSLPHIGKAEMIDGRLIVAPAGYEHGGISSALLAALFMHVRDRKLGWVSDSSTGFYMRSGDLLSPDVAFVSAARLKGMKRLPRKFFQGSPDLLAEVLSPNDKPQEIERKMTEYFASDTKLAWLVDPVAQAVTIYHDARPGRVLSGDDVIEGESIIPGFTLPLEDLFAQPDFG
ncbi:MAG: Uma2 family endonuclease [Tepidisphaeraceae bacterium]